MQIGTRMLGRAEADAGDGPGHELGGEPTLLAVVPIPGTGTSLAIVGYPVTSLGSVPGAVGTVPVGSIPAGLVRDGHVLAGGRSEGAGAGLLLDHEQRRVLVGYDGGKSALAANSPRRRLDLEAAHPCVKRSLS